MTQPVNKDLSQESPVEAVHLARIVELLEQNSQFWGEQAKDHEVFTNYHRNVCSGQSVAYMRAAKLLTKVIRKHTQTLERLAEMAEKREWPVLVIGASRGAKRPPKAGP